MKGINKITEESNFRIKKNIKLFIPSLKNKAFIGKIPGISYFYNWQLVRNKGNC